MWGERHGSCAAHVALPVVERDDDGRPRSIGIFVTDVTDRRAALATV